MADLDPESPEGVAAWAAGHGIGLVVIGPEAPLVAGVADAVRAAGIPTFGPNGKAAQMEGSKKFAKEVMERAGVPTAAYRSFTDEESCAAYVREVGGPIVVKADGLAAGKGVIVAKTTEEALEGVHECFSGAFGQAGATVVVEEMMEGPECSLLALTDGKTLVPLATSQDHKRALVGDLGPTTGGMGVFSPVPRVTPDELAQMIDVEKRVVAELAAEGITYSGCLYGGFMLTKDGPKVLEFNARFGDPETQAVLARLRTPLGQLLRAAARGEISEGTELDWDPRTAVDVVMAAENYPDTPRKGDVISGLDEANALEGVHVIHAGTVASEEGVLTAGGRVLAVVALGDDLAAARNAAYEGVRAISWAGAQYRTDIALKAVENRIQIPAPRG